MRKLLCVCLLGFCIGCSGIPVMTVRAYHDSVGAALLRYSDKDERLDDEQKQDRRDTVASMERLLQEAEK